MKLRREGDDVERERGRNFNNPALNPHSAFDPNQVNSPRRMNSHANEKGHSQRETAVEVTAVPEVSSRLAAIKRQCYQPATSASWLVCGCLLLFAIVWLCAKATDPDFFFAQRRSFSPLYKWERNRPLV